MKEQNFLHKLKKEKKLQLVEPSEELSKAYTQKSQEYLQLAKLVIINKFYEAGTVNTYYSMYYISLALLFLNGIKSENHTATLILLKKLFDIDITTIKQSKKDRIDSQYYLPDQQQKPINEQFAKQALNEAQNYYDIIRTSIETTTNAKKEETRKKFQNIFL
ncbi:MAG: HEPN domain-containing protein [bacterium]|nr:HEPN domain-containing protein [bacterium]